MCLQWRIISPLSPVCWRALGLPGCQELPHCGIYLAKCCFSYCQSDHQVHHRHINHQGVGVAIVSAKLIANPEIKYRHLGVLLFKVEPSAIANVVIIIIIFVTTIVTIVLIIAGSGLYWRSWRLDSQGEKSQSQCKPRSQSQSQSQSQPQSHRSHSHSNAITVTVTM